MAKAFAENSQVCWRTLQLQHSSLRKKDQEFEGSLGYSRQLKAKVGTGSPCNLGNRARWFVLQACRQGWFHIVTAGSTTGIQRL